jgi:cell division protein FtsI (penicillin-binding protein 3)
LLASKIRTGRARVLWAVLAVWFAALALRAFDLQVLQHETLSARGARVASRVLPLQPHRGSVYDRHREPLAISTPVESLAANPRAISITPAQLAELANIVGVDPALLRQRLDAKARSFVYIKRHLAPEQAMKVARLSIPGLELRSEYRRYYPAGEAAVHLVGITSVDDVGQEGVELAYQDYFSGRPGSRRVVRDARGHVVESGTPLEMPTPGQDLALTLDVRLQYLAYRELLAAVNKYRARAGGVVVLDAQSGEILAAVNLPTFNPNDRGQYAQERVRNRLITDVIEPGSTMKAFAVAAALEAGVARPDTVINTEGGKLSIGPATISDDHPRPSHSVTEVIQHSSNVGAVRLALAVEPRFYWSMLRNAGFGQTTGIDLPGEVRGVLRDPEQWRRIDHATLAFGHGMSVTLLQLARAYMAFAGDGSVKPVTLIQRNAGDMQPVRVMSPEVAHTVRAMLETVTQPGGTAMAARVAGYRVAGKTGTARKLENGRYTQRYVASFVGLAPASNPRLIVAVMLDEPQGLYYGGLVAGPVFSAVMGGSLRLLGVPPDAPETVVANPAAGKAPA